MTLPPASANSSSILALTSGDAPQPQSSPKVMVPSATSEIRTPDLPKSLYLTRFPHFLWMGNDQRPTWATGSRLGRTPPVCQSSTLRAPAGLVQSLAPTLEC